MTDLHWVLLGALAKLGSHEVGGIPAMYDHIGNDLVEAGLAKRETVFGDVGLLIITDAGRERWEQGRS